MSVACINRTGMPVPTILLSRDFRRVLRRARRWRVKPPALRAVSIVFVTSRESRRIKRMELGEDRPANVLSFRYGAEGEIILTPEVIRREAKREHQSYPCLLRRMAVHGLLHALGYHHERSRLLAVRFETRERHLARFLGIAPAVVRRA